VSFDAHGFQLKIIARKSSASWRETMICGPAANSVISYSVLPFLIIPQRGLQPQP
jgi:hypothetical protein